jgi:membrane protein implicated in regulation of membrane protease activity
MTMDGMELIYWVCFFLGFGFAVVSGLLAGVFSGTAAHLDIGGHADLAHGAHGDVGHGESDGSVHFSPLSPVVLAMFISAFGGVGLILMKYLHWPLPAHLPLAALSGFVIAGIVFALFHRVFSVTQGSSESIAREMIGQQAEVTVTIPHQGLGEIAYVSRETRYTNPAQSADGKELPTGTTVKILKLNGPIYVVQKTH